jgi:hypothetical protein
MTIQSAESNRAVLKYIKEEAWGETPGSGVVDTMRITKSSLSASKQTKTSDEIRSDRMVPNIAEVGATSGGDISCEFSAGSQDPFFEMFLLGAWTKAMNFLLVKGASVAVTGANEITIAGADWRPWLADNQWLKLEGFLTVTNNKYVRVNGTPSFTAGNTVIAVDETLTAEAGSAYTKVLDAGDVIDVGTDTTFTSGNTIDVGTGAFGTLRVGQKIYVEGLGKETGTITCAATDPTEGDTVTLSDGVDSVTFEIRSNASLVAAGNVHVALSGTEATLATNLAAAINDQFRKQKIRITAVRATAVLTLTNHRATGGSITESTATLTTVNFTGGSATKSGFYTIASLPDADTIVVAETLSTDANAGTLTVVVKGSHLRNMPSNGIVKQSVSVETGFEDVAKYFKTDGQRIGGFDMQVKTGDIVTVDFKLQGRATVNTDTSHFASGYTVRNTTATEVMNATANVGQVLKDGAALSTAVTDITLKGDSSLRNQPAVGEKFPAGIGYGRFMLSGSFTAYFQNFDLYNDFLDHTTTSLQFDFEDVDHNKYFFRVPAVKLTSDPIKPDGIDKDVMEEISWEAQRDPVLDTQFLIDRFSSVYPMAA